MSETIYLLAGSVLSLIFSYVPGASDWFNTFDATRKRLVMLILLAVVTGAIYAGACTGLWDTVPCTQAGIMQLAQAFFAALIANQATYLISPEPKPDVYPERLDFGA
jgi:hypothetical protein